MAAVGGVGDRAEEWGRSNAGRERGRERLPVMPGRDPAAVSPRHLLRLVALAHAVWFEKRCFLRSWPKNYEPQPPAAVAVVVVWVGDLGNLSPSGLTENGAPQADAVLE
ncbi:hypothetical protein ZWY2020_002241 [Hordeum vulgare]|nr:hypothetical protein ZWY2020_002241 [Hordeum vulgare]